MRVVTALLFALSLFVGDAPAAEFKLKNGKIVVG